MKNLIIPISGMTCAACANRIEKKLKKTSGVTEANVNLSLEKATVKIDKNRIDLNKIIDVRALHGKRGRFSNKYWKILLKYDIYPEKTRREQCPN